MKRDAVVAEAVTNTGSEKWLVTLACGHKKFVGEKRVSYECRECGGATESESTEYDRLRERVRVLSKNARTAVVDAGDFRAILDFLEHVVLCQGCTGCAAQRAAIAAAAKAAHGG